MRQLIDASQELQTLATELANAEERRRIIEEASADGDSVVICGVGSDVVVILPKKQAPPDLRPPAVEWAAS
jgi:hypothetical protein